MEALQYEFFRAALVVGLLASIACGIVGTYVVVKNIVSVSGGVSHAAFGGVGLGYLLNFDPIIGATGFALVTGMGVGFAYRRRQSGLDTLIAMFWSIGMAVGIFCIALRGGYAPDLMSYLFGSILFTGWDDVWMVGIMDGVILFFVAIRFRQFQAVVFDEEFAEVMGLRVEFLFQLLMVLISLAVVSLIRVVGVIMVIALLAFPAATARQWSDNLRRMMVIAVLIGAFCTTLGLYVSYWLADVLQIQVPPGPIIILLAAFVYAVGSIAKYLLGRRSPAPQAMEV